MERSGIGKFGQHTKTLYIRKLKKTDGEAGEADGGPTCWRTPFWGVHSIGVKKNNIYIYIYVYIHMYVYTYILYTLFKLLEGN